MTLWDATTEWFGSASTWIGDGGILQRLLEHLAITVGVLALACAIALPVGILIGHRRRGAGIVTVLAGGARAIPTLGLLTVFGLAMGIGLGAPILALVVLAIPPVLAGAYSGIAATDGDTADAARAIGLSEAQIISGVELPLAAPVLIGGLRSATLQLVATATLVAYTADAGLGRFIFAGLKGRQYGELIGGSLLVVLLALVLDAAFAALLRRLQRRSDQSPLQIPVPERTP